MESVSPLPGVRFCPMDDELILFYLKPMLSGENVPGRNRVVFDYDLYGKHEPWQIWDEFKTTRPHDLRLNKDLYFFTRHKHRSSTDKRIRRNVGTGSWHGDDRGKPITCVETGALVGFKKRLTYKNQDSVHDGCWILYEFNLDPSLIDKQNDNVNKDYVLCLLRKNGEPKNIVTKVSKKRKQLKEDGEISKKQCTVPSTDAAAAKHPIFSLVPEEELNLDEYGGLSLEEMEQFLLNDNVTYNLTSSLLEVPTDKEFSDWLGSESS